MAEGDVQSGSAAGGGSGGELSEAELQHLVEKVYRLLQSELRLARARGEPPPGGSSRVGGAPL
jgi:hypothetical protein